MSRSFKRTPRAGDTKDKYFKRYANRRLRHRPIDEEVSELQGNSYKKDFCSWNICDYETVGETFEQFYQARIRAWHRWLKSYGKEFPTREQAMKDYLKWYIRK